MHLLMQSLTHIKELASAAEEERSLDDSQPLSAQGTLLDEVADEEEEEEDDEGEYLWEEDASQGAIEIDGVARWLSESPRWLLTKGFIERAEKELERCAAMNGRKLDWTSKQRENIQRLAESLGSSSTDYSYIDLFRTPRLRRISICAGLVWFGVAFSYYGISLDISGFGLNLFLTHFLYSLVEVPAKLSIYHLLNYLGRRRTQVLTLVMTGACIGANVVIPSALGPLRTTVAIIGKGFSEASFTAIILYTAELYPTVIRQVPEVVLMLSNGGLQQAGE
ncbi:unnamed protein product [Ranitomeya imitator]|uniref:Uncharacterized protein n=1 Tax=Ranitomeya imitator TaxID=111125 RepID=A0ABN9LMN5_9NEOB|nr:unnamed protein product [Ranitomeya imitator]